MGFFTALREAAVAAWQFGGGWRAVAVSVGSVVMVAGFCFAAYRLRATSGWLSAIFGMMAATVAMWWAFGILPSAWVYYADGQRDLLGGTVIPESLPAMANFYTIFRDAVVAGETGIALLGVAVIALWVQKRFPRALAEGEESRPQSGGYK